MSNFMGGPGCTREEIDIAQHVKTLKRLRKANADAIARVKRKRWRPSEKAMTIASFMEDDRALEFALKLMEPKP